ncbi:MAG: NADH-quinone oxidoreductase subunit F, partial [Holophagales bacterium]|nr:NADH-quinone oxidoreductase subunit F [Holophagales bacterium]
MNSPKQIDLQKITQDYASAEKTFARRATICAGTGCMANGALKVFNALHSQAKAKGISLEIELDYENKKNKDGLLTKSGCQGFCQMGPLLSIKPDGILYCCVKPEDIPEIIESTLVHGNLVERLLYRVPATGVICKGYDDIPFYKMQQRTVLKVCGNIDPENLNEYIAQGGYSSAKKVFASMTDEDVCKEILASGLRGRGGGGFPTGRKWELTRIQPKGKKYVVCNGDEGDPGAFMDRSVMEGNPHSVIEGMMICAKAIGADEGYVYVRAEYPLAVARIKKAVCDAEKYGILGDGILGTDYSFRLHVMEGAGAFVCGEETALIASIEGCRGMPSPKPPFPAQSGLNGKPTVINNVETLASVPMIIANG